ncbi:hypothetical protein TELCIR_18336, partial [Teladorsagia circumcincta]
MVSAVQNERDRNVKSGTTMPMAPLANGIFKRKKVRPQMNEQASQRSIESSEIIRAVQSKVKENVGARFVGLSHSYYSMKCGAPGLCFANGAFHPVEGGHPSIVDFYKQCMPRLMSYVIGPMRSMAMDDVEFVLLKAIVFFGE